MKFNFDPLIYHYPSRRNVIYGKKGMVATGNPLAANAGLEILKKGGNAIDAAIATAAALTVVEPTANGIGGDAFALVWSRGKLHGLNASGPSPKKISIDALKERGLDGIPTTGVIPVNVPGAPAAWAELWKKFGSALEFKELLKPAISYAKEGFIIQPGVGSVWEKSFYKYSKVLKKDKAIQGWFDTFAPEGKLMKAGDLLCLEHHGNTLEEIGDTLSESIYRGELAEKIANFFKENGGFLELSDLEEYYPEWVEPISIDYKGYDIYQLPPNGHGITVLMALNILKQLELGEMNSFNSTHYQIEALKLAFVDVQKYVADPRAMKVTVDELLSMEYAKNRAKLINHKALMPEVGKPSQSGTVYLATADQYGNMVSFIQSNYMGFGSGIVIPNTGIAMHNRGCNFNLDPESANCLEGGKKSYHTIIPGFLMRDGKPVGPFGVMGGFMQPQGHLQVLINTIEYKLNPQDALDRPRWQWTGDRTIEIEQSLDNNLALQLERAGHDIVVKADSTGFGRGEIIWRDDNGVLCGACEPRTDGYVAVW
ncbi:Gamma-glutamyltransferase [[Clostridium] ultunense Esp]|uniref:Gamma-glutamyltransferase n=1 Tax=[Clostridium] ultunense Esp TaxID=1288971 RepID=M1Z6Q0_9FIRM|nr:gamma-glutamyltransferase family protein [Schnuerera ultunensis]CCQ93434.1 Gamma-glutamyltransferase [[Clostridium] ultunense Esp]SHD76573.1 Gamma-glutamyltransferase [[Clostridium] ultunense Esp]